MLKNGNSNNRIFGASTASGNADAASINITDANADAVSGIEAGSTIGAGRRNAGTDRRNTGSDRGIAGTDRTDRESGRDIGRYGYKRDGTPKRKPGRKPGFARTDRSDRASNRKPVWLGTERSGNTSATETEGNAQPPLVGLNVTLSSKSKRKAKEIVTGKTFESLFSAVSLVFGEHWKIDKSEASELAVHFNDALETLPKELLAKFDNRANVVVPWLTLGVNLTLIILSRYELNKLYAQPKQTNKTIRIESPQSESINQDSPVEFNSESNGTVWTKSNAGKWFDDLFDAETRRRTH